MSLKGILDLVECSLTCEPLIDPVITPCGHTFDRTTFVEVLSKWKRCPNDRIPCSPDQLRENAFAQDFVETAKDMMAIFLTSHEKAPVFQKKCSVDSKEYEAFFSDLQAFNVALNVSANEIQVDDRGLLLSKFCCPLSGVIMEDPVVAKCGHTFQRSAIQEESLCPIDGEKIRQPDLITNYLAKGLLDKIREAFSVSQAQFNERSDLNGVWIYVMKDAGIDRVNQIAKSLGFFDAQPINTPLHTLEPPEMLHNPVLLPVNNSLF